MIDSGFGVKLDVLSIFYDNITIAWRNNPKIYKWCRQYEPLYLSNHINYLNSLPSKQDLKMFIILDKAHVPLGVCGLSGIDRHNGIAEFNIYIGPVNQGKGYGKAALKTLVEYGFGTLRLNHIFGESFEGNTAMKMFESVGFKRDGIRRSYYYRDGKYVNTHIYSILRDEWPTL